MRSNSTAFPAVCAYGENWCCTGDTNVAEVPDRKSRSSRTSCAPLHKALHGQKCHGRQDDEQGCSNVCGDAGQDVPVSRRPRGPRATRKSEGRVRLYTEVQPRLSSKKSRSDFLLSPGLQCPRKRQSGVCVIRGQEVRVCARLYMEGQPSARAYTRLPENRAGLRPLELFLSYVPWQLSCERRPPAFRAPPGPGR